MVAAGTATPLLPGELPSAFCDIFGVAEWAKQRRRRVVNPRTVNARFDRASLAPLNLPSRKTLREVAFHGKWVCCLDASSYFDQFPLADGVGRYFCFADSHGVLYRLTALAMGQRQSTHIATALMRLLLAFDHPTVQVDIQTDNVRFVGDREDVIAAVSTFCERCTAVGVVLNELPPSPSAEQVRSVVVQQADFSGEIIDYRSKTVRIRQKIVDKVALLWSLQDRWTNRNVVALMACLLWCRAPLRVNVSHMFAAMCLLRDLGRLLQSQPDAWNHLAAVTETALDDLSRWTATVLANQPTPIQPPHVCDEVKIVTDASAWGWAAACVSDDGAFVAQMPWGASLPEHLKLRSTAAEPEAVWRALCRFVLPTKRTQVLVLTDHAPFVAAVTREYSASAISNAILARITERFPLMQLRAKHTPGKTNPMDLMSRGFAPDAVSTTTKGVQALLSAEMGAP